MGRDTVTGMARPTDSSARIARSTTRLFAWAALVVGHSLFNAVTAALSDIPEDRMYRYEYALGAALQFAVLLAGVLLIARPGRVRDIFGPSRFSGVRGWAATNCSRRRPAGSAAGSWRMT